jgi:CHAD domain-containing protein
MSFRLKRSESPADGLRRIARELAEQALAEAAATDRDTATRVHNARKCTKKTRSILRLARRHLGETFRVENALIRDAARRLSASRDAAVLLATFDALVREQSDELRAVTAPIRDVLVGKLSEAASAACAKEQLALFADDMRELLVRIDEWVITAHDFDAVGDGLVRSYRDGRSAMKAALDTSDAAAWHEWRKRVKDHWYHVRLLRNVWKPVMKAREKELKTLSDVLGEEHDLAVLQERISNELPSEPSSRLLEAIERKRQHLQSVARPFGERIYAEKPKALGKRLDRYWEVWRSET